MLRFATLLPAVFYTVICYAQTQIVFLDQESNEPVDGAFIKAFDNSNDTWKYYVTNQDGRVKLPGNSEDLVLYISHLNYQTLIDTLTAIPENIFLSPIVRNLEEIVITGQYEPQSAENVVYHVKSIGKEEIISRGAQNLEDLLATSLNIRLQNDPSTGTTSMTLQGISGENIKVLIDGAPLAGRVGNQIDLNQIDISQVEKIEIVEGPMAVNYGSNAMGGVINVITKKSSSSKWTLNAFINEGTVGEEYGIDHGIHNQHISGSYNFYGNLYGQLSMTHNYFGGYYGDSKGRSTRWDPKEQLFGSFLLKYNPGKLTAFYKLDYLNETIDNKGEITGALNPIAIDEEYRTIRYVNQLQLGYKISNRSRFNSTLVYTDYDRIKNQFVTDLVTGEKPLSKASGSQDTTLLNTLNFRGSVTSQTKSLNLSYEVGYDLNLESGQGGRIEGSSSKQINDIGIYSSAELIKGNWKIRPGIRVSYNSVFASPVVPSLNIKWDFFPAFSLRAGYGKGFRAPGLKELYLEFVDATHRIFGNTELIPEDGHHLDLGLSYLPRIQNDWHHKISLDLFYNAINNKIDFGQSPLDPTLTTYINIDKFKSLGGSMTWMFSTNKLRSETGLALTGRSGEFKGVVDSNFLFSPEAILNVSYQVSHFILVGFYYKYTGPLPRYVLSDDINPSPVRAESGSYNWLELTSVFTITKALRASLGIKNVFNVKDIDNGTGSSPHGNGATTPIAYGRSGFLKLELNLNGI